MIEMRRAQRWTLTKSGASLARPGESFLWRARRRVIERRQSDLIRSILKPILAVRPARSALRGSRVPVAGPAPDASLQLRIARLGAGGDLAGLGGQPAGGRRRLRDDARPSTSPDLRPRTPTRSRVRRRDQAASKHCTRLRDTAIQEPDRDRASCCSAPARPPFDEGREALAPWRKRQRAHQAAKADRSGLRRRPHSAPGDMSKAHLTQAWLAVSDDPLARSSGEYFYHQQLREPNPIARDVTMQDQLLSECARISGVALPK